jgi:FSR family fosmidomycin resistance protein-like MFS transporter
MMTLLIDSIFSSVALGHMMVDLLNGSRPVLLAYLSKSLGLTNTSLAFISTIYVLTASITQPVFGWLNDRFGPRWVAGGGLLWMMGFFTVAMFLPGYSGLACLVFASLGSAAFHPAGATQATLRGRSHFTGRETTAASMFFMFGQLGFFFGPIVSGPLLDVFGVKGLLIPAALLLPIGLNAGYQLRRIPRPAKPAAFTGEKVTLLTVTPIFIALLTLIASLQAWAQQNMVTFVPKYLADLGQPASVYGLVAGLFMGGSALGNVVGGTLADRYGKVRVAMTALVLASIPLFVISRIGWSPWLYLLIPLSGGLTGSVHSIVVVIAQRSIRGGMGLASGLTLGIMFSAGALGTMLFGPAADSYGFPLVFQLTSGLVLLAALLLVFLQRVKQPELVTA